MPKPGSVICRDIEGGEHEVPIDSLEWRPSAYGILLDKSRKKVLLTRQFGAATLPGGGVDLGEMPEAAMIREFKEETGLIVDRPRLVACQSTFHKMSNSSLNFIQSILLFYECRQVGGELSIEFMTETELTHGQAEMPIWVSLDDLDIVQTKGSLVWKDLVKDVAQGKA